MVGGEVVRMFVVSVVIPFVLLPAMGGGAVKLGHQMANIGGKSYFQCWKVYLASCCYAVLALIPLGFMLQRNAISQASDRYIRWAVFCALQLILIPLFLRSFSRRGLGVTLAAVLLTNLGGYLLMSQFQGD
jgi:hypothetical protein